jgi:hypothetical protein
MNKNENSEAEKILFFGYFLAWLISAAGVYKFYSGSRALGLNLNIISIIPLFLTCTGRIKYIYTPWVKAASFIGETIQRLFLCIFYFGALFPIGLLMKLFKGDFLDLKRHKNLGSYWNKYTPDIPEQEKHRDYSRYNVFSLFFEYWRFLMLRKKYWLLPLILFLILLGIFIIFVQGSAISPFIYTVF